MLVFDRGGAFPEAMAELRDAGAGFVTYERKPYPELGATEFEKSLTILAGGALYVSDTLSHSIRVVEIR